MPVHGSGRHALFAQPKSHAFVVDLYVHCPLLHAAPLAVEVIRVLPLHSGPGGLSHLTPAQGSVLHAPLAQPKLHAVSIAVYVQLPALHVPLLLYFRCVFASLQMAVGGVAQDTARHGSVEQACPWHVHVVTWDV
jgi:hypothetical protein